MRPIKLEVILSARAQSILPVLFGKIKQSYTELVFALSIALVFLSFSYFVFDCTFFTLHFVKHKEKHLKSKRIWKLLNCFYFQRSGWRKWPEVKFHLLSNARERAHESVNGPLRLLPTFRGQKNRFFFYLTKFKFVILSSVSKRKTLKISKSGRVT